MGGIYFDLIERVKNDSAKRSENALEFHSANTFHSNRDYWHLCRVLSWKKILVIIEFK